jgi:hypothetical protein
MPADDDMLKMTNGRCACSVDEALELVKELARCHGHMQARCSATPAPCCQCPVPIA